MAAIVAIAVPGESGGDDASQPYPTRQVEIMAPAAPGGGWDTTAREFQKASRDAGLDGGSRSTTSRARVGPWGSRSSCRRTPAIPTS